MSEPEDDVTIPRMVAEAMAVDPTRPLITYYDGESGERTELSGASLDNWIAKTANLLVDDCGLGPGSTAALALPPHWQTAAVLLGCFSAGVGVTLRSLEADVVFATVAETGQAWAAADRFVLALAPMAQPAREVPEGWADYVTAVRVAGDRFVPSVPVTGSTPALSDSELHHAAACTEARQRAHAAQLHAGDRLLLDAEALPDPMDWLLAPLAAAATIVLCHRCDPGTRQRIRAEEGITR